MNCPSLPFFVHFVNFVVRRFSVACEICGCPEARWLSTETVAMQLACSARTVRRMIERGDIDGTRLRGRWRVDHESLDAFVGKDSVRHFVPARAPLRNESKPDLTAY